MQRGQIIAAIHPPPLKCNLPLRIKAGSELKELGGLIDTGNKVRFPLIISGRLAELLKLKLNPPPLGLRIGTAAAKGTLRVKGIGAPVAVQIHGHNRVFRMKPLVIQNLSHHVNLGSSFLNKAQLKLDFSGENPRVIDPDGAVTEMIHQIQEDLDVSKPTTQELVPIVYKGVELGGGHPRGIESKGIKSEGAGSEGSRAKGAELRGERVKRRNL